MEAGIIQGNSEGNFNGMAIPPRGRFACTQCDAWFRWKVQEGEEGQKELRPLSFGSSRSSAQMFFPDGECVIHVLCAFR